MVRNVYGSSCKVGVILVRFEWNLNFLNIFTKSIQIPISWQTVQGGVELFHSDRRTDRNDEANSYFSKFCKSEVRTNFKILLSPLFYCIIIFRFHSPLSTDLIYFPGRFPKRIFVTITWIFHFILNSANSTSYSQHNSFLPSCMNKVKIIPYPSSGYDTRRKQVRPLQYTHTHTHTQTHTYVRCSYPCSLPEQGTQFGLSVFTLLQPVDCYPPKKGWVQWKLTEGRRRKLNDRRFRDIKSYITQAATLGKHKIQTASFVKYCTPREESDYWYAYYRITEKEKLQCSVEQNTTAGL
jgi:hypothetical protein